MERQLIENIHHEPLAEIEKAKAIKKLIEMKGWNEFEAAQNLGIADRYLRTLLSLIESPPEIQNLVKDTQRS